MPKLTIEKHLGLSIIIRGISDYFSWSIVKCNLPGFCTGENPVNQNLGQCFEISEEVGM